MNRTDMLGAISEYLFDNGIVAHNLNNWFLIVALPESSPPALDKIEIGMQLQESLIEVHARASGCWEPPIRIELTNPNSLDELVLAVDRLLK